MDPTLTDSDGRDAWMHFILFNECDLLEEMAGHYKDRVLFDKDLRTKNGQSHLHFAIMPNEFGWIDNAKMLRVLLKMKIGDVEAKDSEGRTPY